MGKEKAYCIIYDSEENILFGQGGKVGENVRNGLHLPGGSIDKEDGGILLNTALRELKEEIGIEIKENNKIHYTGKNKGKEEVKEKETGTKITGQIKKIQKNDNENIYFFLIEIDNVEELSKHLNEKINLGFRPINENPYDQPFASITCLKIGDALKEEWIEGKTDWFYDGLQQARDQLK